MGPTDEFAASSLIAQQAAGQDDLSKTKEMGTITISRNHPETNKKCHNNRALMANAATIFFPKPLQIFIRNKELRLTFLTTSAIRI